MRFRCSSIGKLMTEPRSKSDGPLSVGAKTYIRELAAQEIFGVDFVVSSKAIECMARQPEQASNFQVNMFISIGLIESMPIISIVIAIVLVFANPFVK